MEEWHIRLKELRKKKGLSQADLAREISTDISTVSRYENGRGAKKLTFNFRKRLEAFLNDEEIAYIEHGGTLVHKEYVRDNKVGYNQQETPADVVVMTEMLVEMNSAHRRAVMKFILDLDK